MSRGPRRDCRAAARPNTRTDSSRRDSADVWFALREDPRRTPTNTRTKKVSHALQSQFRASGVHDGGRDLGYAALARVIGIDPFDHASDEIRHPSQSL